MFDALFRRGNPTNTWSRDSGLTLTVDLSAPSLNSIGLGSAVNQFSFLGRSTSKSRTPLDYADLGISLDNENDGTISGFQIVLDERQNQFSRFPGVIQLQRSPIELSTLVDKLGEPYWRDEDEEEIIWFYEFPSHEVQIEQSLDGPYSNIVVTKDALMADAGQRKSYGVSKSWPPF